MSLEFATATELAQKIRTQSISSRELTDLYIERIERLDGERPCLCGYQRQPDTEAVRRHRGTICLGRHAAVSGLRRV